MYCVGLFVDVTNMVKIRFLIFVFFFWTLNGFHNILISKKRQYGSFIHQKFIHFVVLFFSVFLRQQTFFFFVKSDHWPFYRSIENWIEYINASRRSLFCDKKRTISIRRSSLLFEFLGNVCCACVIDRFECRDQLSIDAKNIQYEGIREY